MKTCSTVLSSDSGSILCLLSPLDAPSGLIPEFLAAFSTYILLFDPLPMVELVLVFYFTSRKAKPFTFVTSTTPTLNAAQLLLVSSDR
jgi:hypothetical protein